MKTNRIMLLTGCLLLSCQLAGFNAGADTNDTLNPGQVEQFAVTQRGSFGGVGMSFEKVERGLRITEVFNDAPAAEAGLKPGEVITAISGAPTGAMNLEDATRLCRGPVGTKVTFEVGGAGASPSRRVELIRKTIVFTGVSEHILDSKIGLLAITMFNEQTSKKVKTVLDAFRESEVRGLIVDLRKNHGGSYSETRQVAGYLVGSNQTLWLVRPIGQAKAQPVLATAEKVWDKPMIVLISGKTASGGELLASALKSSGRAKLLGQTTAGDASMKNLEKQPDGSLKKVVKAECFTIQDEKISGRGIKPDLLLETNLAPDDVLERATAALPKP